jgi:FtsZ-binding cell division protein ZapB
MERLNEKHEGESPKVTLRMDPSMIKVVDREAKRIDGTRSAALRSLVMRATGDGVTVAIGGAMVAQAEVNELKARLEKAEHERDEAIAQRKEADRSANRSAKKTMDAWNQVRKDLDAAKREREDLITSRNAIALERDTLKSHLASVETERDDALAQLKQRDEEISTLRTAHKIIAETPAEVVREAEQPMIAPSDDAAVNDALRARYRALSIPLRAFVAKHSITRTPFQKWVAGERDMHGETLAKYEAAIKSEE